MGILSALGLRKPGQATSRAGHNPRRLSSPWSSSALESVVLADIFDASKLPPTRAQAMQVPAVAKNRHLVCGLGRQPLRAYQGADVVTDQPAWLTRTDSEVPPQTRMTWTLDDLFFSGWSLWQVERDDAGAIIDAWRVPPERWSFDAGDGVLVDDALAPADSLILFSGPYEGLLEAGAGTVRAGLNLEASWAQRVRTPIPVVKIVQKVSDEELGEPEVEVDPATGEPLDPDDARDFGQIMVDTYVTARRDPNGAVLFVPYGYDVEGMGEVTPELYIEGRNAIRIDVAGYCNTPANLADASLATASLTYTTRADSRSDYRDMTADFWLTAIEARLSMDDVCPPGQRIAFDLSNLTTVPDPGTAPVTED